MHSIRLLIFAAFGCTSVTVPVAGTAPTQSSNASAAVVEVAGAEAVAEAAVERCVAQGERELPPPTLPGATNAEFRESVTSATSALRCCDPAGELSGVRLVVELMPESRQLARGRLADVSEQLAPAIETCLNEQLATWVVRPAPRSDVIRRRLSPFGPRYASSTASIRLALPTL